MTMISTSQKARHLAERPRISLCVDDETPPYAFVTVHGTATVHNRPPDLLEWTTRIARRYVPGEDAEAVGRRYAEFDDLIVRVRPDRVIGRTGVTE
jgi:PPOX class probable F420-dependent enzyme